MDFPIFHYAQVTSTFDQARQLAQTGELKPWSLVIADQQSSGRGQLGRNWQSKPGNLYVSLCLPSPSIFQEMQAALYFAGLLAQALSNLQMPVWIKWPNDLVIQTSSEPQKQGWHKVGGILIEERANLILAGFGLNLKIAPNSESLRVGASLPAACLPLPACFDQDQPSLSLITPLVSQVHSCYLQSCATDWRTLVQPFLIALHQPVSFIEDAPDYTLHRGIFTGLSPDGGLCLHTPTVDKIFHSGSLQL